MSLFEFITLNRIEILDRTRSRVAPRKWPLVSEGELERGLPLFLSQLTEALRRGATEGAAHAAAVAIGNSATEHGGALLAEGLTVAQVVHDYGEICQAITEAAVERKVAIASEDFQILNLCLDNAIAGAVTEFIRQREATLDAGESERLGYLTHELRNLLSSAVLSFAAVKSGRVPPGGSTGAILERSLLGMREVLDNTISEVRLTAGTHEARRISLSRLLGEVGAAARLQAEHREMRFEVVPFTREVMMDVDPQLLSSAVFNLLQNAFKYSAPHGRVVLRGTSEGDRANIAVEDECGGLPEGNAETLFTPFGARRSKDRSGLGLGLNISRKVVKTFGGDIHIQNLPGKGCIFSIALPVLPA